MSLDSSYKKTIMGCYVCAMTQAVAVNLPPILFVVFRTEFGLSFAQIGTLVLANFVTQIIADLLATRFGDKLGYRPLLTIAHVLAAVGLGGLSLLPYVFAPFAALILCTIVYAFGCGMIEVLGSPLLESVPDTKEKATALTMMHSFYSWGYLLVVLLSVGILSVIGLEKWRVLPLLFMIFPLTNVPRLLKMPIPKQTGSVERSPFLSLLRQPLFLCALGMMVCAGSSELVMSQWASLFAQLGLGVDKSMGDLLGPCLFAFLMGCGRMLYGVMGARMKLERILAVSGLMCTGCYLLAALAENPSLSFMGCALCGLSISIMWPGTMSVTARTCTGGLTTMFGLLAVAGDVGCSLGPWITGLVSDSTQASALLSGVENAEQVALKSGLLAAIVFPLLLIFLTIYLWKKGHEAHKAQA